MINGDENSKSSIPEDDSGIQIGTPKSLSQDSAISVATSTASTDFKQININLKRSPAPEDDEDDTDLDASGSSEPVSRKEKSLGKLCKRFLLTMDEESSAGHDVHLESVARNMSVEKRRIYDIVNVMEALEAMRKTNKSYYKWNGLERLPCLMHQLAKEALVEKLPAKILQVEQAMCSFTEIGTMSQNSETVGSLVGESANATTLSQNDSFKSNSGRDRNGKNSLAQLCRRFLMVLLCNPKDKRRVSLDVASTVLIKDPESEGFDPPSRSRCRRLYDIANVLVAMNLIKKVHYLFGTKKIPLFVYCGPEPEENPAAAAVSMKAFLAANGMTEAEVAALRPPAAKLRRVSSDVIPKKTVAASSAGPSSSSTSTLQRSVTLSELNKPKSFSSDPVQALADFALKNKCPVVKVENDENDKENAAPSKPLPAPKLEYDSSSENTTEFHQPIPRPIQRQPLGALNTSYLTGLAWPGFSSNIFAGSPYLQLLNAAQQQQQQQQNSFLKPENKLYQPLSGLPPMSLPSLAPSAPPSESANMSDLAKAAFYLQNFCNSQPKY
uniref:E2F_TDP domain-containing protein n=1 Tax=Panagrellus redivivus TaxID=6233 RepID=A0A7E4VGV1_PANRE